LYPIKITPLWLGSLRNTLAGMSFTRPLEIVRIETNEIATIRTLQRHCWARLQLNEACYLEVPALPSNRGRKAEIKFDKLNIARIGHISWFGFLFEKKKFLAPIKPGRWFLNEQPRLQKAAVAENRIIIKIDRLLRQQQPRPVARVLDHEPIVPEHFVVEQRQR